MTEIAYVDAVRVSIGNAPIGRLPAIGKLVGIDIDLSRMQQGDISKAVAEMQEAVLRASAQVGQLSEKPTREEFIRHLAALTNLNKYLDDVHSVANGEAPAAPTASTEERLRAQGRIQDDPEVLVKLGYKGKIPQIPKELLEDCARTGGTAVLKFRTTITDLESKVRQALGPDGAELHLNVGDQAKDLAIMNDRPEWINVPNTVDDATIGKPKVKALALVPGSSTCHPMDTVLMLVYNLLATGQQMPGFKDKFTFTDQKNTFVGSGDHSVTVNVDTCYDAEGCGFIGLARRTVPGAKG